MIVCSCHAVSDSELRRLALAGLGADEVERVTRAGTSCGCCVSQVREVVAAERGGCGKSPPCPGCACRPLAA
jgi:bacterioferritin-associated ferredoxin